MLYAQKGRLRVPASLGNSFVNRGTVFPVRYELNMYIKYGLILSRKVLKYSSCI
jgi:hypothetical protein